MLVSETRELLKKYKEEDLRLLVLEMYKSMPKKLREEKGTDELLQDVHAYLGAGKIEKTKDRKVDIKNLKLEIDEFVDYAYKQYYFAPNSYVHKKDRPKWRFKVKAYIKSLQVVPIYGEDGTAATELLEKLYNMLCYACAYYIFNTESPFSSVGIKQKALLDSIIARKFGNGINKESVKSAVALAINSIADRETLHSSLINVLVENLKSPDSKEIAVEQSMALKAELDKSKPNQSRKSSASDLLEYQRKERINNLVELVFRLNVALCEYDKAIEYYVKNNDERNAEVSLYVLLHMLLEYELIEYWLREYKKAVKKGVKPRESLQETYENISATER